MACGPSADFGLELVGIGIEDEVSIGWVKANEDFTTGISAPDRIVVVMSTQADLASSTDLARPDEGGQVSIDAAQVEVSQFVLRPKRMACLP